MLTWDEYKASVSSIRSIHCRPIDFVTELRMNFNKLIVIVGCMVTYSFPSEPHFSKTKTCMVCRNGGLRNVPNCDYFPLPVARHQIRLMCVANSDG
jgi:hypothetical protein